MDRNEELVNKRYDALMFAQTPETAQRAAKALIEVVLGEDADKMTMEAGLREVCRQLRPASDPRDQARFEAEFLELALLPSVAPATGVPQSASQSHPIHNGSRARAAA